MQDGVDEVIDKHVLFQLIVSSLKYSLRFEFTDKDEITVTYYYYINETSNHKHNIAEADANEAKWLFKSFLIIHLENEFEYLKEYGSKENVDDFKEEKIKYFQEVTVPSLSLQTKVHRLMKVVRKEVEDAKNEIPF